MRIIYGGDEAFNAVAFGLQSQRQYEILNTHIQNVGSYAIARTGEYGEAFMAQAMASFDKTRSQDATELAKMAINQVDGIYQHDVIRYVGSLQGFQIATPRMQQFLMAEPTVRKLYHDQRIDGWSDTYVDRQPGVIGEDHYEYRRVHSGVVKMDDESWHCDIYSDELYDPEDDLSLSDQVRIMNSQAWLKALTVQAMKEATEDPTNPWGTDL